jgi:protein TonB
MFDMLLESRPSPLGLPRWGIIGAIGLHAAAIGALVRAPVPPPPVPPIIVIEGFPTDPPSTAPVRGGGSEGPVPFRIDVDLSLPPLPVIEPIPGTTDHPATAPVGPEKAVGVPLDAWGLGNAAPLPDSLVQERPELLATPQPVYPARLREAGVEGSVVVQVVVDTMGRAEPASVRVLQHSESGFDAAALEAIRGARFRPARVWGRAVRVLVQVPVAFRIRR